MKPSPVQQLGILLALTAIVATPIHAADWARPQLADPQNVKLSGVLGDAFDSGVARIGKAPYTAPFVLADVSFTTNRWFTNYSGDISGRFLELASVTSARANPQPAFLPEVLDQVSRYQKPDGHFGTDVNWHNAAELHGAAWDSKVMPIFWGNGRLLLGLTASYARFQNPALLQSARKLADFYVTTAAEVFCDPKRTNEYQQAAAYAGAYVTCYFEGMEGLVQLYRITHDQRYLDTAVRMADFHEPFDTLPVGHSHGSLSQHEALLMLYEETNKTKYLDRAISRWDAATKGGYVSPAGGVLEKFVVNSFNRDEGCSEADWLRVSLMLWHNTGQARYLDMAERTVWNEFFANRWADGGYGHRNFGIDNLGPYAFQNYSEESLWCCTFHCPLALNELKSYLAVAAKDGIYYNFPVDFQSELSISGTTWKVNSKALQPTASAPVRTEIQLNSPAKEAISLTIRIPDWAENVVAKTAGAELVATQSNKWLKTAPIKSGSIVQVDYLARPCLETRRFERIEIPAKLPAHFDQVVIRHGPNVLLNPQSGDIQPLQLHLKDGILQLPADKLVSWAQLRNSTNRHAFVFKLELLP